MIRGTLARLRQGLQKTRSDLVGRLQSLLGGKTRLDADTLDRIEELLIRADMGVAASLRITRSLEQRVKAAGGETTYEGVLAVIRADLLEILRNARPRVHPPRWGEVEGERGTSPSRRKKKGKGAPGEPVAAPGGAPAAAATAAALEVVFVVGVNGTGKTTSIAKLAHWHAARGRRVLLAAADTFRAAAIEQLVVWAERVGVPCVRQAQGSDPAAVVHDALSAAAARGADLVIVDTAGRLHTKVNLMAELAKIARVIEKKTGRPPRTLLVVDANTGQNGLAQARMFAETIPVDGLILAKLDGTAKGGIVVAIAEELGLPVLYVGTGETAEDLAEFDPAQFVEALLPAVEPADGEPPI